MRNCENRSLRISETTHLEHIVKRFDMQSFVSENPHAMLAVTKGINGLGKAKISSLYRETVKSLMSHAIVSRSGVYSVVNTVSIRQIISGIVVKSNFYAFLM